MTIVMTKESTGTGRAHERGPWASPVQRRPLEDRIFGLSLAEEQGKSMELPFDYRGMRLREGGLRMAGQGIFTQKFL